MQHRLMLVSRRAYDIGITLKGTPTRLIRTRKREETNIYKDLNIVHEEEISRIIPAIIKFPDGVLRLNNNTNTFADILPIFGSFRFADNVKIDDIVEIDFELNNELPNSTVQWIPELGNVIKTVDEAYYESGACVVFTSDIELPAPLTNDKIYFASRIDDRNFQLCYNQEDAEQKKGFIEFTSLGSGNQYMVVFPRKHTVRLRIINIEPVYYRNEIQNQRYVLTIDRHSND